MRSRHAITAALALSVVTILTVAACGSAVQGSAQVNSAAAETLTSAESTTKAPTTSSRTTRTTTPTDLSDLSSMLNDLSTELSVPSDLTDLSFPTDLTDLSVPNFNDECLTVAFAVAGIGIAAYEASSGQGNFDSADLQSQIDDLLGSVPAEIAPDVQALGEVATAANGQSSADATQLFESEKWTTAIGNISDWLDANCNGS